jgi:undecaprenyl-diphosphatase
LHDLPQPLFTAPSQDGNEVAGKRRDIGRTQARSGAVLLDSFDVFERSTCQRINAWSRHTPVCRFFGGVSRLGDGPAWIILGLVCGAYPGIVSVPFVAQAGLTALLGVLGYKLLKDRLVRERPFIRFGEIRCTTAPLDRYSFPSGHTLHAVSFAILYGSFVPQLLWILVPFALLIGLSRVVLGLHYPSDVLAGAALGALLAIVSLCLAGQFAGYVAGMTR